MSKQKDYVAEIMDKWYKAMEANKIAVQPKASTILGTILADYTISTEKKARDIWKEAMTIKGGEFPTWYATLSNSEKVEYEQGRQRASELYDPRYRKQLLKG
jgi:hypothetical protein